MEFEAFPKIPRLNREWIITEKIDGTNAAIIIEECPLVEGGECDTIVPGDSVLAVGYRDGKAYHVGAQSRKRLINLAEDNHGFAEFVYDNVEALVELLGPGRHFGEWAGPGIQKNRHELERKTFFLFNTTRFGNIWTSDAAHRIGVTVVPVLGIVHNAIDLAQCEYILLGLLRGGSYAKRRAGERPGRHGKAEGIMFYSTAANQVFKVTLENDGVPKGLAGTE